MPIESASQRQSRRYSSSAPCRRIRKHLCPSNRPVAFHLVSGLLDLAVSCGGSGAVDAHSPSALQHPWLMSLALYLYPYPPSWWGSLLSSLVESSREFQGSETGEGEGPRSRWNEEPWLWLWDGRNDCHRPLSHQRYKRKNQGVKIVSLRAREGVLGG